MLALPHQVPVDATDYDANEETVSTQDMMASTTRSGERCQTLLSMNHLVC